MRADARCPPAVRLRDGVWTVCMRVSWGVIRGCGCEVLTAVHVLRDRRAHTE
jgi:hypothetical protein